VKIAFITHDVGIYGASRSLRDLLIHLNIQHDVHIIVRNHYRKKQNIYAISEWFQVKIDKIHEFRLPFSLCYYGKPKINFITKIINYILDIKWQYMDSKKLYKFLHNEAFDIIHLNSIVLHQVLNKKFKMIIHMRELYDGTTTSVIRNLEKAKGLIFIDLSTKNAIKETKINKSIILIDPFDMTLLDKFSNENFVLESPYEIEWKKKIVFSIIGRVEYIKGIIFVINVFKQYENQNALLLIVGNVFDNEYLNECKKAIGTDNRIIIYGEEKEIEKIYYISDYIIRGESFACIGRTIYEALYSGLKVIVPGDIQKDTELFFDYNLFRENIYFYKPLDSNALLQVLNICNKEIINKKYLSNIEQYSISFIKFCFSIIEEKINE